MEERTLHLKIKVASLAAEARIIRKEANKSSGETKHRLNLHRTGVLRENARVNLLAYGILRRRPYHEIERRCEIRPLFDRVGKTARAFGASDKQVEAWTVAAKAFLKSGDADEAERIYHFISPREPVPQKGLAS